MVYLPTKPSIEDWVTTCREHGKDMEAEEGEIVVGPTVKRNLHVFQQVNQVQGKPAHNKCQKHCQQDSTAGSKRKILTFRNYFVINDKRSYNAFK